MLANNGAHTFVSQGLVKRKHIMVALSTVLAGIAAIWSGVTYMWVFDAAREHLPPQFQDYENARYALDVWALQHPMPLTVQADHVRPVIGYVCMLLAGALACLSSGRADLIVFGCVLTSRSSR
ncbi:hypothetical protein [Bradyrhizobium symbiodeficiens]|uniref:Uncharacterized protein n=1 Tax=Bradyrhizobium symbiodeficiens TaxID=1404367 RepID=A0A6G9A874_9BRAD|nr:hypothetical protein [Bradyrhizobium symbiodeficiens]QIP08514.1 hypothetical protein HAV00_20625 [Bradyrhizobium symbiodeficiens]